MNLSLSRLEATEDEMMARAFTKTVCFLSCAVVSLSGCGSEFDAASTPVKPQTPHQQQALKQADDCNLDGTWAFKFVIPVKWAGNSGVQGGTGVLTQWARAVRVHTDSTLMVDQIQACGSTVPNYQSRSLWGGETFGTHFPDALYDSGYLPSIELKTKLSGSKPGDTYESEILPIQLGLNLPDPLHDAWPKDTAAMLPFVIDSDRDGKPGISVETIEGNGAVHPPVNYNRRRRAAKFHLGVRDLIGSKGSIVSCDRLEGTVVIPEENGAPALQSRILGCEIEDGSPCSKGELTLANMFQPPYQIDGEPKAFLVRVADNTPCSAIRAMDF